MHGLIVLERDFQRSWFWNLFKIRTTFEIRHKNEENWK